MRTLKIFILILIIPLSLKAQDELSLTLEECIELANDQSLESFLTKNMYLASYWTYKSYKAAFLPSLSLDYLPFNFNDGLTSYWNSEDDVQETVHHKSFNTSGSLSVNQRVRLTGGTLSLVTDNTYTKTMSPRSNERYISTPVSLKYRQTINGFNSFKWRSRIDPERFVLAKKKYIENRENIAIISITKYFNLINAEIELEIATRNAKNSEELFKIGTGRFEVGTITQDELLTLELDVYNSNLSLIKAQQSLIKARISLNIFLNIDKNTIIKYTIPENIYDIEIPNNEAIDYAVTNNSFSSTQKITLLENERDYNEAKADNRFSSTLNLSYGLTGENKDPLVEDQFAQTYKDLLKDQGASFKISIPIIDWGEGKGKIAVAEADLEAAKIETKQNLIEFEQNVNTNVMEFNIQKLQVKNSAKADTIAQKGYDISYEIFKLGKLDVIKLNQAKNSQSAARKAYINSLKNYWDYWYTIRKLTLYDFKKKITLSEDFDAFIK